MRKDVSGLKKYRIGIYFLTIITAGMLYLGWCMLKNSIPDTLHVAADSAGQTAFSASLPSWIEEETMEAGERETSDIPSGNLKLTGKESKRSDGTHLEDCDYLISCSLFGVIPIKDIEVSVMERKKLIPGGMPVGIYMKTEGVLIVGTGEVRGMDGRMKEPTGEMLHSGDYIVSVNGVPVSQKEEVIEQMNHAVNQQVLVELMRNGERIRLQIPVIKTGAGEYKAGIWIRDDTQGIGTLTYMDENGAFGALGHGISDIDTSTLLTLKKGSLYDTEIRHIVKGEHGMPGELSGVIRYSSDRILGSIDKNTEIGIFGTLNADFQKKLDQDAMEAAYKQEIHPGDAFILSEVSGKMEKYAITIDSVNLNSRDLNKSMVIHVTDQRLLDLTGGIVQGMSGSPIVQDGRIIGAVTHVFVNEPAKGYGIFIENMLEAVG